MGVRFSARVHACHVEFLRTMGSPMSLERAPQGFRKRSRFVIRSFVFRTEGRPPHPFALYLPRFSFFSHGSARNFFIISPPISSDWSCNLTRPFRSYRIISSVIHNLLSFTKFLPCPRAEIFARFLRNIIILYISTIFICDGFDLYINTRRNFSFFDCDFWSIFWRFDKGNN